MRKTGKRTLAGMAAGALGLALIPFVGAGVSQAATGDLADQATTLVVRTAASSLNVVVPVNVAAAGDAVAADTVTIEKFARNGTQVGADNLVPAGVTIGGVTGTGAGGQPNTVSGNVVTIVTDGGGTTGQGVGVATVTATNALAPGTWTFDAVYKDGATVEDTKTHTFYVSGVPATASWGAASYSAAASGNVSTTVGVRDASGLPTYLLTGESITISSGTAAVSAAPSLFDSASMGQTQVNATSVANAGRLATTLSATAVASGAYTITAAAAGGLASFTPGTTTLNVTQAVDNADTRALGTGTLANVSTNDVYVSTAQTSVTFVAGFTGTAGAPRTAGFTVAQASGQPLPSGITTGFTAVPATATAATTAQATFTVTATNPLPGQRYTMTITGLTAYTVIYQAPVAYDIAAPAVIAAAVGSTVDNTVEVEDQFGEPVQGAAVTWSVSGRNTVAASTIITDASGKATLSFADTSTSTVNLESTITASVPTLTVAGASTQDDSATTTVKFGSDIAVATISPVTNLVDTANNTSYLASQMASGQGTVTLKTTAASGGNDVSGQLKIAATIRNASSVALEGIPVSVSGSEGVYFRTGAGPTTVAVLGQTGAETSLTEYTNSSGQITVQVRPTKTGVSTVTMTAGGQTVTYSVTVVNAAADARIVSVTPADQEARTTDIAQVIATVTDGFGNPVPAVTVSFAVAGVGLFGNAASAFTGNTAIDGSLTVGVINPAGVDGIGTVSAAITGAQSASLANDAIIGFPAGVRAGSAIVSWQGGVEPAIFIEGAREGRRIVVNGETTGLAEGTVVRPWIRFPGETSYTLGTAQRTVEIIDAENEIGEFAWQRKTGKRTAVIFRTEDESVSSTRVIIPAR